MREARPTLEELRAVAHPPHVVQRVSGEHWAGRVYMRHLSIRLTRWLVPVPVSADQLTWAMLVAGLLAGAVLTIPHWWAAVAAVLLIQLQLLFDCSDGELARWRRRTGPVGIYIDRLGHYVTDAGMVIAVGIHADHGFAHPGRWTTVGLVTGVLVLLTKAETELVQVARAGAGLPLAVDDVATATPQVSAIRRLRRAAGRVPFNRALLALEMSVLALAAAVIDAATATSTATQTLSASLLVIAGIVLVGHLLAVLTSGRLR